MHLLLCYETIKDIAHIAYTAKCAVLVYSESGTFVNRIYYTMTKSLSYIDLQNQHAIAFY